MEVAARRRGPHQQVKTLGARPVPSQVSRNARVPESLRSAQVVAMNRPSSSPLIRVGGESSSSSRRVGSASGHWATPQFRQANSSRAVPKSQHVECIDGANLV